jgi:rubrerythrin
MDDATKRMAEGVLAAMRAETEGHHFYKMAALSTQDEQGKEVFEQLAAEELDHFEFLKKQYGALLETGAPDSTAKLGSRLQLRGESPIFSSSLKGRLGEAHFEMTALSVGIQLELSAQSFYKKQGEEATNDAVRAFFLELAEWEAGHYDALLTQQESLKEDYWAASRFSPF